MLVLPWPERVPQVADHVTPVFVVPVTVTVKVVLSVVPSVAEVGLIAIETLWVSSGPVEPSSLQLTIEPSNRAAARTVHLERSVRLRQGESMCPRAGEEDP